MRIILPVFNITHVDSTLLQFLVDHLQLLHLHVDHLHHLHNRCFTSSEAQLTSPQTSVEM